MATIVVLGAAVMVAVVALVAAVVAMVKPMQSLGRTWSKRAHRRHSLWWISSLSPSPEKLLGFPPTTLHISRDRLGSGGMSTN